MAIRKKRKKPPMPWRLDILKHHKRGKSRASRTRFTARIVRQLKQEAKGRCQCGCGRADEETHHVMPRTRGGRGVLSNGMRVAHICNQRMHSDEQELQHWIQVYKDRFGPCFWWDEQDWEEHWKGGERFANGH